MDEDNITFVPVDTVKESIPYAKNKKLETSIKQPIPGWYTDVFHELADKCKPEKFMTPYDPVKVGIANELYDRILDNEDNEEELRKLRLRAIKELGIKISTERLYNELLKVCNPKQFTGAAYNKDLLALANQVYPSIRQNADNISALESIRKQADKLYRYKNKKEKEKRDRKQDERERDLIFIYTLLLCFIIFLLFYFLHHILHITC